MSISAFTPPLIAVPVADAAGWRISLGQWAIVAALSLVPWIALLVHPRRQAPEALLSGYHLAFLIGAGAMGLATLLAVALTSQGRVLRVRDVLAPGRV